MPAVRVDASCGDSQLNFDPEGVVAKMICFFPKLRDAPCNGDEDVKVAIHYSKADPTGPPFVCKAGVFPLFYPSFCYLGGTAPCCLDYWNQPDYKPPRSGITTLMYDRHQLDNPVERKP